MEHLTQTVNLQPAVTAMNLACLSLLNRQGIFPDLTAGHSLGEYSALCAARVLSAEDTLKLVHKRGQLMHREATQNTGAMHAIVGLPIESIQDTGSGSSGRRHRCGRQPQYRKADRHYRRSGAG